jgi:hypothetical protein
MVSMGWHLPWLMEGGAAPSKESSSVCVGLMERREGFLQGHCWS